MKREQPCLYPFQQNLWRKKSGLLFPVFSPGFPYLPRSAILPYLLVLVLAVGCAGVKTVSQEVYSSASVQVKLVEQVKKSGEPVAKGYEHPWQVDTETLNAMLESIQYRQSVLFLNKKPREAFPQAERKKLLEPIREAFARATPDQVVDFSFVFRKKWTIFQREYTTDGIMFRKDGTFNCAFRNLAYEEMADPEGTSQPFLGDPTERPYRTTWTLKPIDGQILVKGGSGLLGPKVYSNWIQLDSNRAWISQEKPLEEEPLPESTATAVTEKQEEVPAKAAVSSDREEIEKRLHFLEELYKEGSLSKYSYENKKKDLMKRLEALPPATE